MLAVKSQAGFWLDCSLVPYKTLIVTIHLTRKEWTGGTRVKKKLEIYTSCN